MHFETIDFTKKIHNLTDYKAFYGGLSYDSESISSVLSRPAHAHTEQLADIISADMAHHGMSAQQEAYIELLKKGNKVVIAGQQAGLFMSPSYIIHKIISILVVAKELKEQHDYDAVPVFWIAGEDHDFEEVNHTHVYDSYYRRRVKVSYKPNLSVPMSVGFYNYDKKAMHETLDNVLKFIGDSTEAEKLKNKVSASIDRCTSWTELFHSLVHETFKEDGLIIFNSHTQEVRELEVPILKNMFNKHSEINDAFKTGQQDFLKKTGNAPMIQTDTDVHLFGNSKEVRELLIKTDAGYKLGDEELTHDEVLARIAKMPDAFSNNVVTRPLMQESLFNTAIFLGGGAEVAYWGELHKAFDVMNIKMPIIMKRMEFIHVDARLDKLLKKYDLTLDETLVSQISSLKSQLIKEHSNEGLIADIENIKQVLENAFKPLYDHSDSYVNKNLIDGNKRIHMLELDYLKKRYNVEVKRGLRTELNNLEEVSEKLMPNGVLQERLYHPWQYSAQNWDYAPLSYTNKLIVVKL